MLCAVACGGGGSQFDDDDASDGDIPGPDGSPIACVNPVRSDDSGGCFQLPHASDAVVDVYKNQGGCPGDTPDQCPGDMLLGCCDQGHDTQAEMLVCFYEGGPRTAQEHAAQCQGGGGTWQTHP